MLRFFVKLALSIGITLGGIAWVESGITCTIYNHDIVPCDLVGLRYELAVPALRSRSSATRHDFRPRIDPWGHSYRWFALDSPKDSTPDFQIYTLGEDGTSASKGNDPDDINSWDDHHDSYYMRKVQTDPPAR